MKEYFAKLKYLFKWRDVAFAVILLTIALIGAFCQGQNLMTVTFGAESVDVVTDKYSMNIPYDMVASVEVAEYSDDDENVDGRDDMVLRTGVWMSQNWGEYHACLDLQTDTCILVRLNDGRLFVFSHKSDEKVMEDFNTLQSYLNN